MISHLINSLYFFLFFSTLLGVIFVIIHKKINYTLLAIFLFCFSWRLCSLHQSSRYYSIFIIGGVMLSTYALIELMQTMQKKRFKSLIEIACIVLLLFVQLQKVYSGFRNNYIYDLQDDIKLHLTENKNSVAWIYNDEYYRIKNLDPHDNYFRLINFQSNNLTDLFFANNYYNKDILIVLPQSSKSHFPTKQKPTYYNGQIDIRKIENHLSNTNHNKFISVFKVNPYAPSPDFDINSYFEGLDLFVFIPEYEAYIYQMKDYFVWVIGGDISPKTEIVYQLYTDKTFLLPQNRIQYGFDNLGFKVGSKYEIDSIGRYRVFKKQIPSQYPIKKIRFGFSSSGKVLFRDCDFSL